MKIKKSYALAIFAHPDDESFLMAGTSLNLAAEGKSLTVISATRGEKGHDRLDRNLSQKAMGQIRTKELIAVGKILKIKTIKFYDYPDGGLETIPPAKLIKKFKQEIESAQPEILVTFGKEGMSGHKDHVVIYKLILQALKQSKYKPAQVWLAGMPASRMKEFNAHLNKRLVHKTHFKKQVLVGVPDRKLMVQDIKKYKKQKLQALKAHASQYVPGMVLGFLDKEYFEVIKLKS